MKSLLVLEDGRHFAGSRVGPKSAAFGEVIFNTSMTGYQEILSDPSYTGQIVVFTAPQIGNYGVHAADMQSDRPRAAAAVVRELTPLTSNWRAEASFEQWLRQHQLAVIAGVDTRALTRHIRQRGAMRAGVFHASEGSLEQLVERVRQQPLMEGRNLALEVTTPAPYAASAVGSAHVVVIDFGVKRGIVERLTQRGLRVTVVPATYTAEQILDLGAQGVLLSNGPGDPAPVKSGIAAARGLLGKLPLFGICLGHQILALALGAKTFKMRFGHHGGNHPVRDERSGELWITAQNHGFAVDPDTLPDGVAATHTSLYDGTLEGFIWSDRRVLAIQFHPEACPGPSDADAVFDRFVAMLGNSGE